MAMATAQRMSGARRVASPPGGDSGEASDVRIVVRLPSGAHSPKPRRQPGFGGEVMAVQTASDRRVAARGRAAAERLLDEGVEIGPDIDDPLRQGFADALVDGLAAGLAEPRG